MKISQRVSQRDKSITHNLHTRAKLYTFLYMYICIKNVCIYDFIK